MSRAEVRKAQINKESVVAVLFYVEKDYEMMWKEGLLIKLCELGVNSKMHRWLKNFLFERTIQVRVKKYFSKSFVVENGTPQGSKVSPLLFSRMRFSLFADDWAIWKKGRIVEFIV